VKADPLSPIALYYLGKLLVQADRPEEALAVARQIVETDGEAVTGPLLAGDALQALGRAAEAVPEFERATQLDPKAPLPIASLAFALIRAGREAEARATYAALRDLQRERPFTNTMLALVAADLGEREDAIRFYERALDAHEFDLVDARDAACLGPLRHDARFVALERRLAAEVRRDAS
jgi:tetratricopeptide (TPR) repeat protein